MAQIETLYRRSKNIVTTLKRGDSGKFEKADTKTYDTVNLAKKFMRSQRAADGSTDHLEVA